MNYQESIDYLLSQLPMFQKQGNAALKKDLSNIKSLCNWLKHPQRSYKTIHIAGTNGKGSVSHYLAIWLQLMGYKVGLYTSPHYKDFRERIKIDGKLVCKSIVKKFVTKYKNEYQNTNERIPSFFELTVAMAFHAFQKEKVDIAIIETGLGGRLDSTNIINPILSIITNISLDHTHVLGNTIELIAKEKAGIIKKNTPILIGEKQKLTTPIFKKVSNKKNATLSFASEYISSDKNTFTLKKKKETVVLKHNAAYKTKNITTALAAINLLEDILPAFSPNYKKLAKHTDKKLKDWQYLGRMQVLQTKPKIILDSAHNKAGLNSFFQNIEKLKFNKLHIVLGMVKEKDLSDIIKLFPTKAKYYFVQAKIPRALDKKLLQKEAKKHQLIGKNYSSVKQGLKAAKLSAQEKDLIVVVGSIFVVAEVV